MRLGKHYLSFVGVASALCLFVSCAQEQTQTRNSAKRQAVEQPEEINIEVRMPEMESAPMMSSDITPVESTTVAAPVAEHNNANIAPVAAGLGYGGYGYDAGYGYGGLGGYGVDPLGYGLGAPGWGLDAPLFGLGYPFYVADTLIFDDDNHRHRRHHRKNRHDRDDDSSDDDNIADDDNIDEDDQANDDVL